jgi:hypothetical protein
MHHFFHCRPLSGNGNNYSPCVLCGSSESAGGGKAGGDKIKFKLSPILEFLYVV